MLVPVPLRIFGALAGTNFCGLTQIQAAFELFRIAGPGRRKILKVVKRLA
jgi:hypothetical protein